jgi:O-antigen/teichoic acid export membrane protein
MMQLLPVLRERGDDAQARGLLLGARLMGVGCATLIALLGLLLLAVAGHVLESHLLLPACLALICVPIATLTDLQDGIGRANGWLAIALLPPYVLRPLLLLAAMAAAHVCGMEMSARTAAGCAILATWLAGLVQTLLVQRHIRSTLPTGRRIFAPARWLGTSLPLLAFLACEVALQNVDVLVISRYLSPTDVAIYFAAAKTMSLVLFVHYAVGSAVANRLSALGARADRAGLEHCVRDAVNWTFWPSLAGTLLLLALGPLLLALFGSQFSGGFIVMLVLALGFLSRAAVGPSEFLLNMLGEQKLSAAVLAATAVSSILLSLLLVPRFGIVGAALANATALIGGSTLNAIVARRRLGLKVAVWHNWQLPSRPPRPL